MKKNKIIRKAVFLPLLLLLGCTKLLFENPMPNEGEIIRILPGFFDGIYIKKGDNIYYQIERINDKHCIIQSYAGFHKDSLYKQIEKLNTDSTRAELRGSTLIFENKNSPEILNTFRVEGNYYYTQSKPRYEINLEKGYFIDDFEDIKKKKAMLRFLDNKYFLNVVEDENWFLIWFEEKDNYLFIHNSGIADTSFNKSLTYYNGLTSIEKIADETYLANPFDEEFYDLLEEPDLFKKENWIRVETKTQGKYWSWEIITGGIVFLIIAMVIIVAMKK